MKNLSVTTINQCTVILTRNCNLRCSFCYAKQAGYNKNDSIQYEDLKHIIDFCAEGGVKHLFFLGGEPTLYPELIKALQYVRNKHYNMIPAIATNGIVLDNFDYCKELVDNGISYIDISLKEQYRSYCDVNSKRNYFARQMNAIKNLSNLPIEFTCSMVLTKDNVNYFCELIKTAHDNGARQFSFTFVIDNEDSPEKELKYLESNNPFYLINSFIAQLDKLNSITTNWWVEYSFPLCAYTKEQLLLLKGKLAAPCQVHTKNGIVFDTDMSVLPCDMCTRDKLGKLGTDFTSYEEFVEWSQNGAYKDVMDNLNVLPSEDCLSCEHLEACYGGCPVSWKNYSFESLKNFKFRNI